MGKRSHSHRRSGSPETPAAAVCPPPEGRATPPPKTRRDPKPGRSVRRRSWDPHAPGRRPGLPSPFRHAFGKRTGGREESKSVVVSVSYSKNRKWKFPGPGPYREVIYVDRSSREMFTRGWRESIYSPGEQPSWLRTLGGCRSLQPPPPAHGWFCADLEAGSREVGNSRGQCSSCLYIESPSHPRPGSCAGRRLAEWVSFPLQILLAGPQEPSGRPARFSGPRALRRPGQPGRGEEELGPRSSDVPEAHRRAGAPGRARWLRLPPDTGCRTGCP